MSHVGNGKHDFDELNRMDLDPDTYDNIKQTKIQARDIINRLAWINSWDATCKLGVVLSNLGVCEVYYSTF